VLSPQGVVRLNGRELLFGEAGGLALPNRTRSPANPLHTGRKNVILSRREPLKPLLGLACALLAKNPVYTHFSLSEVATLVTATRSTSFAKRCCTFAPR
jgi:hypothetical protein